MIIGEKLTTVLIKNTGEVTKHGQLSTFKSNFPISSTQVQIPGMFPCWSGSKTYSKKQILYN